MAAALAGLRANEARYFKNKYDHSSPSAGLAGHGIVDHVHHFL